LQQHEADALTKTTRMNLLLDFYDELLTEKQRTILSIYFHDDFSLGEIATEFGISRQAVYDNIKRAQQALEAYEHKLGLLKRHERIMNLTEQLKERIHLNVANTSEREIMQSMIDQLRSVE